MGCKVEKYVIIATDSSKYYSFYLPIVAKIWRERIGYEPIILLVGREKEWVGEKLQKVVLEHVQKVVSGVRILYLSPVVGFRSGTMAQLSRLYVSIEMESEDYLLTSDVDMVPLSWEWFNQQKPEKAVTLFNANFCNHEKYSLQYIGMRSGVWKEVMRIGGYLSVQEAVSKELVGGLGRNRDFWDEWNYDERMFTRRIKEWAGYPDQCLMVDREGSPPVDRIDRSGWPENPSIQGKVDAHLDRPGYRLKVWKSLCPVLRELFSAGDYEWVCAYREEYVRNLSMDDVLLGA